jgi:hypothetical protein
MACVGFLLATSRQGYGVARWLRSSSRMRTRVGERYRINALVGDQTLWQSRIVTAPSRNPIPL